MPIFLIFTTKHTLWVHVRTASDVLSNNKKSIKFENQLKIQFLKLKILCLLHGQVFVMLRQLAHAKYRLFTAVKFDNFIRKKMFSNFA